MADIHRNRSGNGEGDRIRDQVGKGKTLEQVKAAGLTKDYDGRYGSPDNFIEAAYKSLKK